MSEISQAGIRSAYPTPWSNTISQQKRWMIRFIFFVALLGFSSLSMAVEVGRLDKIVQSYVKDQGFSGAVLVAKGNKILLNKAYGAANLEWNIPNAPGTKFRIASLTKQFTAASILLLEERGKLKLEDPISIYLPEVPEAWRKITIFNLLTHSSGIPNDNSLPDFQSVMALPRTSDEVIDIVAKLPLDFQPGEQFQYSNTGYLVLGKLIEKISGTSYESFLQENIFTPLGMKDTGSDNSVNVVKHHAAGYTYEDGQFVNADFIDLKSHFSSGALYSTTGDLLRWERALYSGKLLSAESLKKMTTPYKDDYALGLFAKKYDGSREYSHTGELPGFTSSLMYRADDDLYVVVLSNSQNHAADAIAGRLAHVATH